MASSKFELLSALSGKKTDQSPQEIIEYLKKLVRQYRDENNHLVERKWDIDSELTTSSPAINNYQLLQEQALIDQKILAADYPKKIKSLLTVIHDMEVELHGNSMVGNNSPYSF